MTDASCIEHITGKIAISPKKIKRSTYIICNHNFYVLGHSYGGEFSVTGDSVGESPEADEMSLDPMMKTDNTVHTMMASTTH